MSKHVDAICVELLKSTIEKNYDFPLRLTALKSLNSFMEICPPNARQEFSKKYEPYLWVFILVYNALITIGYH